MRIDPMMSLVYGMRAGKGVYALVLGSGVSMRANIPTGWDILNDLIVQVYKMQNPGARLPEEPYAWYADCFNEEPDYSHLIEKLAKTPSERNRALRSYFEKRPEDAEGDKEPTRAHRAIARLVKQGFVRVIITTNFDRLIEDALKDEDISPDVISSDDQIDSAMPLIHSQCTVVKVNGDYMDTRIRNTYVELNSSYGGKMDKLLDRIFDEFGMIVCGWSARWDHALRTAMTRAGTRRFSSFWLHRGPLSQQAEDLIGFRRTEKILIYDADSFFTKLEEELEALRDIQTIRHPSSLETNYALLKKWLPDPLRIIQIHDLVIEETNAVRDALLSLHWPGTADPEEIRKKITEMDILAERLLHLLALGCYWSADNLDAMWERCLELLMAKPEPIADISLYNYLPLATLYTMLIASLASQKYHRAYRVLNRGFCGAAHRRVPINRLLYASAIAEPSILNYALDLYNETPMSDHLFEALRKPCVRVLHVDDLYENIFDKVEYLIALNYNAFYPQMPKPMGRFALRKRARFVDPAHLLSDDADGLLTAGFFKGDAEIYKRLSANEH